MGARKTPNKPIPVQCMVFSQTSFDGNVPEYAPHLGSCWIYKKAIHRGGYGRVGGDPSLGKRMVLTHRVVYEYLKGPIPHGLCLDHLCRNPACCNPNHLEPVTPEENQRRGMSPWGVNSRKTHCIHGHEFTQENTFAQTDGGRGCITCRNARNNSEKTRAMSRAAHQKSEHLIQSIEKGQGLGLVLGIMPTNHPKD